MRSITLADETDFAGWRAAARRLIIDEVAPEDVSWSVGSSQTLLPRRSCTAMPTASASCTACCGACGASPA